MSNTNGTPANELFEEYEPDIAGIRAHLANALQNVDCSGFIKELLSRVSSAGNPLVEDGDLVRIFDKLVGPGQGGVKREVNVGGGRMDGSFEGQNAKIYLEVIGSIQDNSPEFRKKYQHWQDCDKIVHGLIHAAGLRSYSDYQLAVAVSQMPNSPPMPEIPVITVDSTSDERYHASATASTYWNAVLRQHYKNEPAPHGEGWHWGNS